MRRKDDGEAIECFIFDGTVMVLKQHAQQKAQSRPDFCFTYVNGFAP